MENHLNLKTIRQSSTDVRTEMSTDERNQFRKTIRQLENEKLTLQNNLDTQMLKASSSKRLREQLAGHTSELQNEIQALNGQLNLLREHNLSQLTEAQSLRTQLAIAHQALAVRHDAREERLQTLAQQELRLKNYAAALGTAKEELGSWCQQLATEIKDASALHPLKDYLEYTKFEVSKTEILLKTAPTSAPDRTALEESFKNLVEQRDFLASLIEASRVEMRSQQLSILSISEKANVTASLPPPPPREKADRKP